MFSDFAKRVLVPLLLRLGLAAVFIFHGWQKVGGPEAQWGAAWNPNLAVAAQVAVAWGELLGGAALALGFLTRLAATGIIAIMAGAIHMVTLAKGFDNRAGGFEYNMVLLAMAVCLVLGGPGPLAVDRIFRRHGHPTA
jgi:putative oxidoreductase